MNQQQRYDELNTKYEDEQQEISVQEIREMVDLWHTITDEPSVQPIEGIDVQIVAIPDRK